MNRLSNILKCSLIVASASSPAFAQSLQYKSLRNNLVNSNTSWRAADTAIARSVLESKTVNIGVADEEVLADLGEKPTLVNDDSKSDILPAKFDWRNFNGKNFVAGVGNQGKCGSCVAFAMLTTLESQLNILKNTPYSPFELSRQFVFSCGGGKCSNGWLLSEAVNYLTESGVPDAACMPYQSTAGKDVPCSLACSDATERSVRISGYDKITKGFVEIDKIKAAILRGPVLSSMIIFEDFLFYGTGVYRHKEGRSRGSHAVTLIGWDDEQQAWIGRNSMGTDWGLKGDFLIAYDDTSLIGRYTYQFKLADDRGFVALENIRNDGTISGSHRLKIHTGYSSTDRVALYAVQSQADVFSTDPAFRQFEKEVQASATLPRLTAFTGDTQTSQNIEVETVFDSSRLEDGTYYVYGAAYHSGGQAFSLPVKIEVKNARTIGSNEL
jgi:C1A family cysteine protease